jgi:hypothetical protein
MVMTIIFSCIRTWGKMTIPLTIGFISVMAGVLVVVIGVTLRDRPAAAPQTGPYELGFYAISYPDFVVGITSACSIFVASCGCPVCDIYFSRRSRLMVKHSILPSLIVCTLLNLLFRVTFPSLLR